MTAIQNYRDQQLQSTSPRLLKLGSDYINLTSSHQYFKVSEAGTPNPSSIEIKAGLVGALSGTVAFSVDSGTATITQSNNTCVIQYAGMASDVVTILASIEKGGNTYEARYTLTKVRDGVTGGYTLIPDLLSETDVVATAADGTGYALPTGNMVKLYQGATIINSGVSYSVSAPSTKNGLTASINATTGTITLSGSSWTSDTESFTFVATYNTVPYAVVYSIAKSKAGLDAVTADLVSEVDVVPSANDGTGYTLPSGNSLRLYKGGAVLSSGVTYGGGATKNGLTLTIDASTGAIALSGTSWTSNSETFTLTAAYSGSNYTTTYKITKAKAGSTGATGGTGATGPRGSVRLSGTAASAAWSDTTANAVLTSAGYATKVIGDIVTLTYSTTWTLTKFWDGSVWAVLSEYIDGNLLVAGTVAGNKIAANYVYAGSINANQITAGLITASQIDSRGLTIKNDAGVVIFSAGQNLSTSYISGLGTLATKNSVAASTDVTGLGTLATKNSVSASTDVTGLGTLATKNTVAASTDVTGLGIFATAGQITSGTVGTYIADAAISSAKIDSLVASKITAGTMTAESLQLSTNNGSVRFGNNAGITTSTAFFKDCTSNFAINILQGGIATNSNGTIFSGSGKFSTASQATILECYPGTYLSATKYWLSVQTDRNLVYYQTISGTNTVLWTAGTGTSDARLKNIKGPTKISGINTINALEVIDFTWKPTSGLADGEILHTGFAAQSVQLIVKDAVKEISNTFLLHKEELIPHLVKAVQELSAEVAELKARL